MTQHLNISLNNDASICSDVKTVFTDIKEHYRTLINGLPPLGEKDLYIIHNPSTPIVFTKSLPNYYSIGLTANGREFNQQAYQFAHELTHIYCDPRVTNWFIESICEMASQYFMEYLAEKWIENAPYTHWSSYGEKFLEYKTSQINKAKTNLNIQNSEDIDSKLRNTIPFLNQPYDRDVNTLIAINLLDYFKENPRAWELLPIIGKSNDKDLKDNHFFENSTPDFNKLIDLAAEDNKINAEDIKRIINNYA